MRRSNAGASSAAASNCNSGGSPCPRSSEFFRPPPPRAVALALSSAPSYADGPIVGLVTKTNTNPFFVKMKQGFEAKAKELGLTPQAYAGKADGDNDGQVAAIEQLIAAGAKGILLVPSDSTAIVPTVEKARKAGILVITLDTPLDPIDAADANFATDNFKAGELIGQWAKATLGDKAASAKIATLDLDAQPADGRLSPPQRLPHRLRHPGQGSRSISR